MLVGTVSSGTFHSFYFHAGFQSEQGLKLEFWQNENKQADHVHGAQMSEA